MRVLPIMEMTLRPAFPEKNIEEFVRFLKESSRVIFEWFTFETHKRSFISAFSICVTVP